ncbi:thioredoxin-disulfide reductase [Candidatus Saccharibacteria bacterium]|nr:thioredoxin-disulfide reductase [Candidatus Saccharibacteria bacterium]MBR3254454.1 thioredoxin-disulfide reductase [Candidatus Saccharibacteria bacterium]
MAEKVYDVIIVGAGIAGMTAAIYARRANKSTLVLESKTYGGQIINTFNIANWPGEPGISGVDLSQNIYKQVEDLGAEVEFSEVITVKDNGETKEIETDDGMYVGRSLIIAVGSVDREMGVPREQEMTGRGVSYCATCDGAFYKDKDVVIVGGGNTAFYDALYLADVAKKVYLVHRRDSFRADAALVEKVRAKKNVEFVLEVRPVEILGEKKVEGLVVEKKDGKKQNLVVDGVFVAVGRVPATKIFSDLIDLDNKGYVVAGEDCRTSCAGVFVAGDCRTKDVRQLVTAASDGAIAANEAVRYLG